MRQRNSKSIEKVLGPSAVGRHTYPGYAERGENVPDVLDQGIVEHDDNHAIRREATGRVEGEIGNPVKGHRRLARSGSTLDQHDTRVGFASD